MKSSPKPAPLPKGCPSCPGRVCGNCGGAGTWETDIFVECTHCNGSGCCPINR